MTSVAEHSDDAAALLQALDASPAIVIGRSYGGEIAIDLAIRYPDQVRALILLEAAIVGLSVDADRWLETVNERVRVAAGRDMGSVGEIFIRSVIGDAAWHEMPEALKAMITDNGPAIVAETNGGDLRLAPTELARIGQPTLVVGAAASPAVFRDMTDRIAEAIPHSRRALVEGGHLVSPADPEVLRFLQGITAHQK
jgi:esterase